MVIKPTQTEISEMQALELDSGDLQTWFAVPAEDQPIINAMIRAAQEQVESYIGRFLTRRDVIFTYNTARALTPNQGLYLNFPPLEVTQVEAGGEVVDTNDYWISAGERLPGAIYATNTNYISPGDVPEGFTVRAEAGYLTLPESLKQAVLLHAAYMHEHRLTGAKQALRESGAASLAATYRIWRI